MRTVHAVHDKVLAYIEDPERGSFDDLALAVFRHQYASIEPYRRYCAERGRTPDSVTAWREIPPVPIQAFKEVELRCARAERTFLSTGTTAGSDRRSRHLMPDLRLYRSSAVAGLRTFLFPDIVRMPILSLVPSAAEVRDSSLAQMVAWAMDEFGDVGNGNFIRAGEMDFAGLLGSLRDAERSGRPCCLMATTAALIRLFDHLRTLDLAFRLPHGSRLMDTGGEKGATRRLSRKGSLRECWNALAIPGYFCVNEYGMAELSSQFYDNVIADRVQGHFQCRYKKSPHWVRTLIVEPGAAKLRPAAPGERGLLCHFDLANAGTALAVLTEDVGIAVGEGFEILGRVAGAETRGCSLA